VPKAEPKEASTKRKRETWDFAATSARTEAMFAEWQTIRQRWSGRPMTARLLAAQLIYAADLLEHGLGAPDVRAGNEEWIDRLRIEASPYPNEDEWKWAALLTTIRHAARQDVSLGVLPPGPRRERRWLLTDARGVRHFGEVPTDEEAAHKAIDLYLAPEWPDMARRITPPMLAAVLPLWRARKHAGGRGGRPRKLWPEVIALGVKAGLRRVSESTVRSIRDRGLKWLGGSDR